jgi:hypothetical protein
VRTGGCQCGAVRYESAGEALGLYICHCRECQKQSASAFGMSLVVPRTGFRVVSGTPQFWTRPADSGARIACFFCPKCGSRLWHEKDAASTYLNIKPGSLDEPVDAGAAIHVWTRSKLPGIVIPDGAQQFAQEPD